MTIERKDQTERPRPVPNDNEQFTMQCDTLIPAFGQEIEPEFRDFVDQQGDTKDSSDNVFVGGDAKRGASTLIKAIADGKYTAWEIMERKGVNPLKRARLKVEKDLSLPELQFKKARVERGIGIHKRTPEERKDFGLVNKSLSEEEAKQEAGRCMACDEMCNICVDVCPNRANHSYEVAPFSVEIPYAQKENGKVITGTSGIFNLEQRYQVLNIKDFCNECGNCETFCPSSGAPYKDKPRLHLTEASFSESETGFFFDNGKLYMKSDGILQTLERKADRFFFSSEKAQAEFQAENYRLENVKLNTEKVRFDDAIRMSVIFEAAKALSSTVK